MWLAEEFGKVIAIDAGEHQLTEARKTAEKHGISNIEFHQGAGEDLTFLNDGSVDLIACARKFGKYIT